MPGRPGHWSTSRRGTGGSAATRRCAATRSLSRAQVFMHSPDNETIEICNCDCLPVVPLTGELSGQRLSKEDLGGCRPRVDLASPEAAEQLSVQQWTLG